MKYNLHTIEELLINGAKKSDQSIGYSAVIVYGNEIISTGYNHSTIHTSNCCQCLLPT
jgi:deoxycytidylate deaminase